MNLFTPYIPLISDSWTEKYQAILAEEHLQAVEKNISKFQDNTLE
ncbi:hypothetical protein [Chryseobacterium sp. OV279]|nr:hypothetical protein [Chryseobacterium sp. OV279]SHG65243.1 hypothetical protein SAMN02787100_4430 [Chryseobacterium sp. OV279]